MAGLLILIPLFVGNRGQIHWTKLDVVDITLLSCMAISDLLAMVSMAVASRLHAYDESTPLHLVSILMVLPIDMFHFNATWDTRQIILMGAMTAGIFMSKVLSRCCINVS